jgi:hypothetical protein
MAHDFRLSQVAAMRQDSKYQLDIKKGVTFFYLGLHNQIISAQTVRNRLSEAHLRAHRPHQGLNLTAVWLRSRLQWAYSHLLYDGH